jgi:hypothetical protein
MTDEKEENERFQLPGPDIVRGPDGLMRVWTPPAMPWLHMRDLAAMLLAGSGKDLFSWWITLNRKLQGAKPNRWIELRAAVGIVAQQLNVRRPGAQYLLAFEATPPAVPWVGLVDTLPENGREGPGLTGPSEISLAELRKADVNFSLGCMTLATPDHYAMLGLNDCTISNIVIELNHLEAWLEEKLKAREVQPVLASAGDRPAEGEMIDFKSLPRELVWKNISGPIAFDKPNRWIKPSDAIRLIAEKLDVPPEGARELLLKEAIPPLVLWAGDAYGSDRAGAPGPVVITRAILRDAMDVAFDIEAITSPQWGYIEDIHIEQNHLEVWLEEKKRSAQVIQLAPSAPANRAPKNKGKGGRPASSLRADVRIQLAAFFEKRGEAWVKAQTTGQLAKEVRVTFAKKTPPVDLGPRQTLKDWIGQWRSERGL